MIHKASIHRWAEDEPCMIIHVDGNHLWALAPPLLVKLGAHRHYSSMVQNVHHSPSIRCCVAPPVGDGCIIYPSIGGLGGRAMKSHPCGWESSVARSLSGLSCRSSVACEARRSIGLRSWLHFSLSFGSLQGTQRHYCCHAGLPQQFLVLFLLLLLRAF